jgi:hypothetical protein
MILNNHMFKIYLNKSIKCKYIYLYFLGWPSKQNRLQVDEILIFLTFLVNGHLKFTYALSILKVKKNSIL